MIWKGHVSFGRDPKALGLPSDNLKALGISEKELRIGRYETSDLRLGTTYIGPPRGQRFLLP